MEGVTHALRDRQYSDRDAQYAWFLSNLKLRDVQIWGFSRINFKYTLLSKRKLQWMVDQASLTPPHSSPHATLPFFPIYVSPDSSI